MSKNLIPLSKIAVAKGLQTGPFGSQLKASEYTETGIPVVMPKDISNGKITTQSIAYTTKQKSKKLSKHLVKAGDILFPRRGNLGRIALAQEANEGWICGTGCLRARLGENVLPSFIHQYVQLDYVVKWLESNALGQTMLNLNAEIIATLPIYLPSYDGQKAIADTLQTWDTAIEKTEALIAAKERQFGWLKSKLLKSVAVGYQNNKKLLPDICKIRTGKKDVNQGNPDGQYPFFTCAKEHTFSDSYSYDMEAILLAGNGYIGNPILYRGKFEAYQRTYILHDFADVDAEYLNYFLRRSLQKKIAQEKQEGAMSYIKLGTLQSIEIIVPSIEEQKRIAEILNTAQDEINLLKKLADQYRTQKRGLMQKLLSGEWHIKNKAAA